MQPSDASGYYPFSRLAQACVVRTSGNDPCSY
jgi:hypothetical protein